MAKVQRIARQKSDAPVTRIDNGVTPSFASGPITVHPRPGGMRASGPSRRSYNIEDTSRQVTDMNGNQRNYFGGVEEGAVHSWRGRGIPTDMARSEHFHAALNSARDYAKNEAGWNPRFPTVGPR